MPSTLYVKAKTEDGANRAYVLQTGQVVLSGPAQELRRNPAIQEAYLGELQVG